MKKLLVINLSNVLFLPILYGQSTYKDSINRAFDNCVFRHDSISYENKHLKDIIVVDSLIIKEQVHYISILQDQVDKQKEVEVLKDGIILAKTKDIEVCERERNKEKRRDKLEKALIGAGAGGGGFILGGFIVWLSNLVK